MMCHFKCRPYFLYLIFILFSTAVYAAEYYVAPNGSDSNSGTANSPWKSFAYAIPNLQPGDVLYLKDGVYKESMNVHNISGTEAKPIKIKALNDGKAIVDGQNARGPVDIREVSDIVVNGIVFKNSNRHVVVVSKSQRITLKRVSAYNAKVNENSHVFQIYRSSYILLEDCVAAGSGRDMYDIYGSNYVTVRRCYGRWEASEYSDPNNTQIMQIYGSNYCTVENLIGVNGNNNTTNGKPKGVVIWANTNQKANFNKILGSVVVGFESWGYVVGSKENRIEGNKIVNSVSINSVNGLFQRGDAELVLNHVTLVGHKDLNYSAQTFPYEPKKADYEIGAKIKNSLFLNGENGIHIVKDKYIKTVDHGYNNLFLINNNYTETTAGPGEIYVDPGCQVNTYGYGAYLMRPGNLTEKGENGLNIGAEVLYRYKDGALTDKPLWPWPMEERVKNEIGVSVTWENNGGLWKTLDGVYTGTNTPPSSPRGLKVVSNDE